ncbi:MAG: 1-aminocyclopropane-1-carboxylate deaminase/D-cysteine desulfhydrase [Oscillospiraceae bacterium]
MKDISEIPKLSLGTLPTPFYKLENISKLTGKKVYIKRDDMTGVSLGGNKVRKLEYVLKDAVDKGCDTIITTGAAQSNHAMLTAACCRRLGLEVHLVLKQLGVTDKKGNLLLDDLMGADVTFVNSRSYDDVYAEIDRLCGRLRAEGKKPYVIPVGASVPLGSLGYVGCVKEIKQQADALGEKIDHIVCCVGSGGTHAGVALGAKLYSPGTKVTGIIVSPDEDFRTEVFDMVNGACGILETDMRITKEDVVLRDYAGTGYSIPSELGNAAIRTLAKNEGLFLDPVYTGKTFAGLLDLCKQGYFGEDESIVFIHSGGAATLFAIPIE